MNGILTGYKVDKKYITLLTILCLLIPVVYAFRSHMLFSPAEIGDEPFYRGEAEYLSQYGVAAAITEGSSFIFSWLAWLVSHITGSSLLISMRYLSMGCLFTSAFLFYKCFGLFADLSHAARCLAVTVLAVIAKAWVYRGLPDLLGVTFTLWAFYLVATSRRMPGYLFASLLLYLAFATKPVALFVVPLFALFVLLYHAQRLSFSTRFIRSASFASVFALCFIACHIPGYHKYHKLMLEDKNHYYVNGQAHFSQNSWTEINNYFELYNVHNKPNKWAITHDEIDSFKIQHPRVRLDIGYTEFVKQHFGTWATHICSKLFLYLPYDINRGFFLARWTSINRFIHSDLVMHVLALLLIGTVYITERRFVHGNAILLMPPYFYFIAFCIITIPQLEGNWFYFTVPFMALPVARLLSRYVNIALLLLLQAVYLLFV